MSSDISGTSIAIVNGTVVAIQGNAVQSSPLGSNQDGYVLTWVNGNDQWEAQPKATFTTQQSEYFTSDGYWTCPAGVNSVLVIAAGGGGSGAGGNGSNGGGGGGGSIQQTGYVATTPGNTYSITIGAGGAGVAANTNGNDGSPTQFGTLFYAFGGGGGFFASSGPSALGGNNFPGAPSGSASKQVACGGDYNTSNSIGNWSGNGNYTGGAKGAEVDYGGGGGGGAGPQGSGAAGGTGVNSGTGGNGSAAGANTGAGGGAGGNGPSAGGSGGAGGSGYLYVIWVG